MERLIRRHRKESTDNMVAVQHTYVLTLNFVMPNKNEYAKIIPTYILQNSTAIEASFSIKEPLKANHPQRQFSFVH